MMHEHYLSSLERAPQIGLILRRFRGVTHFQGGLSITNDCPVRGFVS